jgi:outer membrane receptor protein involved in Fe transport
MKLVNHLVAQLFLFLFISTLSLAQRPGNVTGRIIDATSQEPLEYATLSFFSSPDSVFTDGTITGENGAFNLSLQSGSYNLVVQFVGYQNLITGVEVKGGNTSDLGILTMNGSQQMMDELTISGEKTTTLHKIDRQVYQASDFQSAAGGTASEVIRNMPSVTIDAQGQLRLRGSGGFMVLLNGKPVQSDPMLILNQIPANAIEDIEIITAPSAKYDPDGKGGIINIKTKQGVEDGFYLLVNGQIGLPAIENYDNAEGQQRYGGDFTLNYRKKNWDLSLGANYYRDDMSGRRVGEVNTTIGNIFTSFPSDGERSFDRYNVGIRATAGYKPAENQLLSAGFYAGKRTQYRTADIYYFNNRKIDLESNQVIGQMDYFNFNEVERRGDFLIGSLDYLWNLNKSSTLSASLLYEYTMLGGPTQNLNVSFPEITDTLQYTRNENDNPLDGFRAKVDYITSLGKGKLESGYQFRYLDHVGDFVYKDKVLGTSEFIVNPEFSNRIELKRHIHSVYSQYSGDLPKLKYTAGLRFEWADRELTTGQNEETFRLELRNLFPSVNLLYNLGKEYQLKAAYSRRIDRTTTFKMNPFPEREHSETLEQGDAELLPEFVDLVEIGVIRNFEKGSIALTPYFQRIENVINRVNNVYNDTILNRIYTNAGNATAWGMELATDLTPTSWWTWYLGGNVYQYNIKGDLFNQAVLVNNSSLIWNFNLNSTFKLAETMSLQLGLNYISQRITAQGEDSRFYLPNATLKKSFLEGQLTASLIWQNIDLGLLSSNEQRITTRGADFYTTTNYIHEVDIIRFNLSYQLNRRSKKIKFTESEFGEKEF